MFSFIKAIWTGLGRLFAFLRRAIANLLVLLVLLVLLAALFAGPDTPDVPDGGALALAPQGNVVEQAGIADPLMLLSGGTPSGLILGDLLRGISKATNDDRITTLALDLSDLGGVAPAHLQVLGDALAEFRDAGKTIVAQGVSYGVSAYYLASFADEIYMHPMGEAIPVGYGSFSNYYGGFIEKYDVNVHVFKVGTFKDAVEPYTRSDMSPAAREARQAMVDGLWSKYVEQVAVNRDMSEEALLDYVNGYDGLLAEAGGDAAQLALDRGLVDALFTGHEVRERLRELAGEDGDGYRRVGFGEYLTPRVPALFGDKIAVVTASGIILDGSAPPGMIGATTTVGLLADARKDDNVKAVVLRIDSPGGSAFASERIRREVARIQDAGKPVVASMGPTAASGGYWIAATADQIWAAPTTLTGSIGIFGLIPTFEDTLANVGIGFDGVRTGPLVGQDTFGGVTPAYANAFQAGIEHGYWQFVDLVAEGRDMTRAEVDAVAQGRVWLGDVAQEHGLVDELGHLEDAIAAAAELADLDDYTVSYIEEEPSAQQLLVQELLRNVASPYPQASGILARVNEQLRTFGSFNDPRHMYALCTDCQFAD